MIPYFIRPNKKIKRYIFIFFLVIISQTFSHSYGLTTGEISGFFYQEGISNPLPGALIVLYDANNNLLVDYTYTTENGQFTLKKPSAKGNFYIVATKDRVAQRYDFKYDPQKPRKNIMIQYQESHSKLTFTSFITSIKSFFGKLLEYTISTIIGFFLGTFYESWVNKRKETRFLNRRFRKIKSLAENIIEKYGNLKQQITEYGATTKGSKDQDKKKEEIRKKCKEYLSQILEDIKKIQAIDIEDEIIINIRKQPGMDEFDNFKQILIEIETFVSQDPQSVIDKFSVQDQQLFENLHEILPLFNAQISPTGFESINGLL